MIIGNKTFDTSTNKYIMGILNVTPDSFSDGGSYTELDCALKQVELMINQGASMIDVGGESTRPGYEMVSDQEEIDRTAPIIEAIKSRFDTIISLDTYKSSVARAGMSAGVDMINDIWGFKYDSAMADVVSEANISCVLMHNRSTKEYENFLQDVVRELEESIQLALEAGVAKDKIILDPGVGFGKDYNQNLNIINNLEAIEALGYPVLLGTSRKSVIGLTLDLPVTERVIGTCATTVIGAMKGASFFRVHDVKENLEALKMTMAIVKGGI